MKTASGGLIAHLNTGQEFRRAELWTFTLAGGQVLRYTTLDIDVTVGSDTWLANAPVMKRPRARQVVGVEVSDFDVTVSPGDLEIISGVPWIIGARSGLLRGGRLLIERVYMPTWGDVTLGKLYCMGGQMTDARGASDIVITVKSDLNRLNVMLPADLYQPMCRNVLFDAGCTLSAATLAVAGTVGSGAARSSVPSALAQAADYFALGRLLFTSGVNVGISRSVKQFAGGAFSLMVPLPVAPTAGDTFTAWPGCDRKRATCETKYANLVNFRGEPYIPEPETAV